MQIEDLEVHATAAPPNPITHVTFTGFQFTPKRNYYQTFQSGTSATLAVGFISCMILPLISCLCLCQPCSSILRA